MFSNASTSSNRRQRAMVQRQLNPMVAMSSLRLITIFIIQQDAFIYLCSCRSRKEVTKIFWKVHLVYSWFPISLCVLYLPILEQSNPQNLIMIMPQVSIVINPINHVCVTQNIFHKIRVSGMIVVFLYHLKSQRT